MSVAELKQLVSRPDVVEMYDVTARDPKLLVQLKAHRNTVQVPRHWCYKRKVRSSIFEVLTFLAEGVSRPGVKRNRASFLECSTTCTWPLTFRCAFECHFYTHLDFKLLSFL